MTVKRKRRHSRRSGPESRAKSGLLMGAGLIGGAALASLGLFFMGRIDTSSGPAIEPPAAAPAGPPVAAPAPKAGDSTEKRFDFYDKLPQFEVTVPEETPRDRPDKKPAPVEAPGVYVLQAGPYESFAEADQVKARVAMLGIRSQIQEYAIEGRKYHRVRIGPIEALPELNRTRQKLRDSGIETLLIRAGE